VIANAEKTDAAIAAACRMKCNSPSARLLRYGSLFLARHEIVVIHYFGKKMQFKREASSSSANIALGARQIPLTSHRFSASALRKPRIQSKQQDGFPIHRRAGCAS
jgi:hypothetical protein